MFAAVFVFSIVVAHVTAEDIPSYINVCGRRNPKLDECIMNSVNNLREQICKGFPDSDIPKLEPLHVNEIVIANTATAKLYLRDAELTGLCNYILNYIHSELDSKLYFNVNATFEHVNVNSTYDFNIRVLVPIATNGKVSINIGKVNANYNMYLKKVTKGGKRYVYVSKAKLDLDVKVFHAKFVSDGNADQLQEIINNFIGNNQEEVFKTFKPALEEAISKALLSTSNNMLKHFTYDQLFPDRI